MDIEKTEIEQKTEEFLARNCGVDPTDATDLDLYRSLSTVTRDVLAEKRTRFRRQIRETKARRVCYLCMEFLVGRNLKNALQCLGIRGAAEAFIRKAGRDPEKIYSVERDPGLGNGGLGRLAACYMDSLSSLGYPATGYSICYEDGFFRQKLLEGEQIEKADEWLSTGDVWLLPRPERAVTVTMGGTVHERWDGGRCLVTVEGAEEITAVPWDLMVPGYGKDAVNVIRLWRVRDDPPSVFATQGEYARSIRNKVVPAALSGSLYPPDETEDGKLLRLSQQYFLVSATVQDVIRDHISDGGTVGDLAGRVAIHINDTHPALVIPELMRVLTDVCSFGWDDAWKAVTESVTYTNHTVMPEALETWNSELFRLRLPRIHKIIEEINRRHCAGLWNRYPGDWDRISRMAVTAYSSVRMANLSVAAARKVNGVSRLHTEILKRKVFRDFAKDDPSRFVNVTNGVSHRRWLIEANPDLTELLKETIGDGFVTDPRKLSDLMKYADDGAFLERLAGVKRKNRERLAALAVSSGDSPVDPDSVFDVHIKRMHEYKRQLLGVLKILYLYGRIKDEPNCDIPPVTFIFGGKAAPGYRMAKTVIRLIWSVGEEIGRDKGVRDRLKVLFAEDYNVTSAEAIIPAADISEQISLAGKEASGTGCMKMMMNGAVTIGTLDGANVEIKNAVGDENFYVFGMNDGEVEDLWNGGYESVKYYLKSEKIRRAASFLEGEIAGRRFDGVLNYLLYSHGVPDPYMCLADFDSYTAEWERMILDTQNRTGWQRKSLVNIAKSGYFSSDRSIGEYAEKIWKIKPIV